MAKARKRDPKGVHKPTSKELAEIAKRKAEEMKYRTRKAEVETARAKGAYPLKPVATHAGTARVSKKGPSVGMGHRRTAGFSGFSNRNHPALLRALAEVWGEAEGAGLGQWRRPPFHRMSTVEGSLGQRSASAHKTGLALLGEANRAGLQNLDVQMMANLPINESRVATEFGINRSRMSAAAQSLMQQGPAVSDVEVLEALGAGVLKKHGGITPKAVTDLAKHIDQGSIRQGLQVGLQPIPAPPAGFKGPWPEVLGLSEETGRIMKRIPVSPFPRYSEVAMVGMQNIGMMAQNPQLTNPQGIAHAILQGLDAKEKVQPGTINQLALRGGQIEALDEFAIKEMQKRPQFVSHLKSGQTTTRGLAPIVMEGGFELRPGMAVQPSEVRKLAEKPGTYPYFLREPRVVGGETVQSQRWKAMMKGELGKIAPTTMKRVVDRVEGRTIDRTAAARAVIAADQEAAALGQKISQATDWRDLLTAEERAALDPKLLEQETKQAGAALKKAPRGSAGKMTMVGGKVGGAAMVALMALMAVQAMLGDREQSNAA